MNYFHIKLSCNGQVYVVSNNTESELRKEVLVHFAAGGLIIVNDESPSGAAILNMATVSEVNIYETPFKLDSAKKSIRKQLSSRSFVKYNCTKAFINEIHIRNHSEEYLNSIKRNLSVVENQVFITMRLGNKYLDRIYKEVVEKLFIEFEFHIKKVDEYQNSGFINHQILDDISTSMYIYADMSEQRPNNYFELGLALGLGKTVILSIRKNDVKHFNISDRRFIQWRDKRDLEDQLRKRLIAIKNKI